MEVNCINLLCFYPIKLEISVYDCDYVYRLMFSFFLIFAYPGSSFFFFSFLFDIWTSVCYVYAVYDRMKSNLILRKPK